MSTFVDHKSYFYSIVLGNRALVKIISYQEMRTVRTFVERRQQLRLLKIKKFEIGLKVLSPV